MSDKKIIHIDMDAFFVAVEIRDNPQLKGKPVAVGGPKNSRGVLSTCNYIARQYGVSSAMPNSVALRKCPELIIVPGRMQVYRAISEQLHQIFLRYSNKIEPLSLDEAYLDVSDCQQFSGSATLIAQDIRKAIEQELQLTASAGIAPVKFLAKIASDLNKPNGQFVIEPKSVLAFIETMPLSKIPGVGKVTYKKLQDKGLHCGGDVRKKSEAWLSLNFGKLGRSLWQKCHGIDQRNIEVSRVRKTVGVEHTFSHDITNTQELGGFMRQQLIPELMKRAQRHLTERRISKLGVKVKFKDFQQTTKEFKYDQLDEDVFFSLLRHALARGNGKAVRLLGVHLGLACEDTNQTQQIEFDLT